MIELEVEEPVVRQVARVAWLAPDSRRQPSPKRWTCLAGLGVLCLFLFFYGINTGDLWRTENLRALIAQEFLRSGNWLVPRLYGEPYLTKPPGMYAAIALASLPLGEVRPWSARLPSALAASVCVFLFYWCFARVLGRKAGLLAAVVLPTSPMWLDKAGVAEIDMLQVAWVTGAILLFLRALESAEDHEAGNPVSGWGWWFGALLCVAGGVLTKWTAPVFFYLTVIPLLCWRGRLRLLIGKQHVICATVAAVLVLAWASVAIAEAGWDTFSYRVGREAVARFYPQKYGEPYRWDLAPIHPFRLLATTLPWSAIALLTLCPGFSGLWDERGRRLLQALHCWVWPNMLFWSFIAEHAPRNSFPLLPGIAGLAALVCFAWLTGRLRWPWQRVAGKTLFRAVIIGWLIAKVVYVHAVLPNRNNSREPRIKGQALSALVPPGDTLYVRGLRDKDEGILFNYGRPVRRLPEAPVEGLPREAFFCLLEPYEIRSWNMLRPLTVISQFPDELGSQLVLVVVPPNP